MIDLYSDSDIKIAGSKPSRDIEKRREKTAAPNVPNKEKTENAKKTVRRKNSSGKTATRKKTEPKEITEKKAAEKAC